MADSMVAEFLSCRFPSELIVHIVGCIDCWDLVAMCKANPAWDALVDAEGVWRKASQHRWPQVAGGAQPPMPGEPGNGAIFAMDSGSTPLAMPRWASALDGSSRWSLPSDYETIKLRRPSPPSASAPSEAWCRFYLTLDAFELMSIPTDDEYIGARRSRIIALRRAMQWCGEYVHSAVLMADDCACALREMPALRSLTVASATGEFKTAVLAINDSPQLEQLAIIDSIGNEAHAQSLVSALAASAARLRELAIATVALDEASWRHLVDALWTTRTLHSLDSLSLVGCNICDAQCTELCAILRHQQALKHLNLSNNRLTRNAIVGGIAVLLSSAPDVSNEWRSGLPKAGSGERVGAPPRRAQRAITLAAAASAGAGGAGGGACGGTGGGGASGPFDALDYDNIGLGSQPLYGSSQLASLSPLSITDAADEGAERERGRALGIGSNGGDALIGGSGHGGGRGSAGAAACSAAAGGIGHGPVDEPMPFELEGVAAAADSQVAGAQAAPPSPRDGLPPLPACAEWMRSAVAGPSGAVAGASSALAGGASAAPAAPSGPPRHRPPPPAQPSHSQLHAVPSGEWPVQDSAGRAPAPVLPLAIAQAAAPATELPVRVQGGCKLVSLDLSFNPLAGEGTVALAECIRKCPTLHRLTLQYVTLYTREPANLLGSLLGAELPLRSLNLSFNYISACGSPVEQISSQLGANNTLRELNVRRCCIGGWRRARALARGIMANTALTSIDLSYNGLGAAQAAQSSSATLSLAVGTLCQAFAKNRSLRTVDLSHNALGDAGSAAVVQAVLEGPSITSLNLQSNGISVNGLRSITELLSIGGGRHSWLPVALHTHARHVRIAAANAAVAITAAEEGAATAGAVAEPGVQEAAVAEGGGAAAGGAGAAGSSAEQLAAARAAEADAAPALACSQPYGDGDGIYLVWPGGDAEAEAGGQGAIGSIEPAGALGSAGPAALGSGPGAAAAAADDAAVAGSAGSFRRLLDAALGRAIATAADDAGAAAEAAAVGGQGADASAGAMGAGGGLGAVADANAAAGSAQCGISRPACSSGLACETRPALCVDLQGNLCLMELVSEDAEDAGRQGWPVSVWAGAAEMAAAAAGAARSAAAERTRRASEAQQGIGPPAPAPAPSAALASATACVPAAREIGQQQAGGFAEGVAGCAEAEAKEGGGLAMEDDEEEEAELALALAHRGGPSTSGSDELPSSQSLPPSRPPSAEPQLQHANQQEQGARGAAHPCPSLRPLASALVKRKERGWDAAAQHAPAPAAAAGASGVTAGAMDVTDAAADAAGDVTAVTAEAMDDESAAPSLSHEGSFLRAEERAMSCMVIGQQEEDVVGEGHARQEESGAQGVVAAVGEQQPPSAAQKPKHPLQPLALAPLLALPPSAPSPSPAPSCAPRAAPFRPLLSRAPSAVLEELAQQAAARLPNPFHMSRQKEVNSSMRRILVDWLLELFEELQLPSHALFAGVHTVDRYLSVVEVHKECLQLVGAVSLMLCSNNFCKLLAQDGDAAELRGLATADDVVYWTDNTYTVDEVTAMETRLMHRLGLGLSSAVFAHRSPLDFLTKFAALLPLNDEIVSVAHELMILSTREYALLRFEPSLVAATALVIAVRSCHAKAVGQHVSSGGLASALEGAGREGAFEPAAQLRRAHPERERAAAPDERTLYACTGHSAAEVRVCEATFSEHAVVDSPLACHSVAGGLPRQSKSVVVHLIIRADSPTPRGRRADMSLAEARNLLEENESLGIAGGNLP